ncbi:hypothetical protein [Spirillospora sp. NPDC048819]|uniref:hypothetical protein n=1 Tax=Spirillospora sp. NPDC048819 TaxID=3155268 RepID=UPI0033F5DC70
MLTDDRRDGGNDLIGHPAPPKGRPTELPFCRHHFIASRSALEAAHATVYDAQGRLVTGDDVEIP